MKNRLLSVTASLSGMLLPLLACAQGSENNDFMRQTGKIYVVVAVIAVIFLVLAFYLWSLDKRTRKLEEQIYNKKS